MIWRVGRGGSKVSDVQGDLPYYEQRYAQGYLKSWPTDKKSRVREVISALTLPSSGVALDFGCGNGIVTEVLRSVLPGWRVYGTDISSVAVRNARESFPHCDFFALRDVPYPENGFDLLFTHHVLEHIQDLRGTFVKMCGFMNRHAAMVHVLPCGNPGSFEYSLCLLKADGICSSRGNRFYFEDEAHVRRLRTEELEALAREWDFLLEREFYANQYHGAIEWFTQTSPRFLLMLTDGSSAVSAEARHVLRLLRYKLLALWALRSPSVYVERRRQAGLHRIRDYALFPIAASLHFLTAPIDRRLKRMAYNEWQRRKADRRASEMYLCFVR